jgi:hypothetical protein
MNRRLVNGAHHDAYLLANNDAASDLYVAS